MKKVFKKILLGLAAIGIAIQFIPNRLPENKSDNPEDVIQNGMASNEIAIILKTSCYDCHSNQTDYPWYSYVAPVSWLVASDIKKGREELNFSEWKSYSKRKAIKKLDEIGEMVEEGKMPLPIYTLIHRNAIISDEQKKQIIEWSTQESNRIMGN
jgi:hypothetical protein